MRIKTDEPTRKAILDNEQLVSLIKQVEKELFHGVRSRTLTGFEETKTGRGIAIRLTYDTSILGFNEKQEVCTLFADRDYHLKKIIRKY